MNETMKGPDPSPDFDPFAGPSILRTVPSTEPQREIWTACRMGEEASLAFNESGVLHLEGRLDVEALRAAIRDLVARHEALRSTLSADGLTLLIAAAANVDVPIVDLAGLSDAERDSRLADLLVGEVEKPFDLESDLLVRFTLVRTGEKAHRLLFTAHHIVCDGWSTAVLMKDLGALYTLLTSGEGLVGEVEPFSAYARGATETLGTPEFQEAEDYWLRQFTEPVTALDLPADRPRPPVKTFASRREDHTLPADLVGALRKVGARAGASFFTTLLAGFKAVVHRLSGQEDVVVGIPAAGQSVGGHDSLVGHCVNTLPLRSRVTGDQPFEALLRSLRTTMLDAYEHQQYTFGTLLRKLPLPRDPSRLPLVSVVFNLDQALTPQSLRFEGLSASFASNPRRYETFDLFVNAVENGGQVVLECQYNTDLFDATTIRRWLAAYETLLRAVVADPSVAVGRLPLLAEADRVQLEAWNATDAEYPRSACVHELIEERVARDPERIALTFGGRSFLLWRAERHRQSYRTCPPPARRRPRYARGPVSRAVARDGRGASGGSQGGWSLRAPRSRLPRGPARLDDPGLGHAGGRFGVRARETFSLELAAPASCGWTRRPIFSAASTGPIWGWTIRARSPRTRRTSSTPPAPPASPRACGFPTARSSTCSRAWLASPAWARPTSCWPSPRCPSTSRSPSCSCR